MKFSKFGIGRKNNFRFVLQYDFKIDGEPTNKPYYLLCEEIDREHCIKQSVYTKYAHRFSSENAAAVFGEEVAEGFYTIHSLREDEDKAYQELQKKMHLTAEDEFGMFLNNLQKLGIDAYTFREAHSLFSILSYEARRVMLDRESFEKVVSERFPAKFPEGKHLSLEDWLEKYQNDIEICVIDKNDMKHFSEALSYRSIGSQEDLTLRTHAKEQWLLSLPLEQILWEDGCPTALLRTSYNADQTSFLLDGAKFEDKEWQDLYTRANWAKADFKDKLDYLKNGKSFENEFDGRTMDVVNAEDRKRFCKLLQGSTHVCVAPMDQFSYSLCAYIVDTDKKGKLDNNLKAFPVRRTKPGAGLTATLDGQIAWSAYRSNIHEAELQKENEQNRCEVR